MARNLCYSKDLEIMRIDIADAIRGIAKKNNISVSDLAKLSGMQYPNIYRIISRRTSPTLKTLIRIADAFGIKLSQLIKISEK